MRKCAFLVFLYYSMGVWMEESENKVFDVLVWKFDFGIFVFKG